MMSKAKELERLAFYREYEGITGWGCYWSGPSEKLLHMATMRYLKNKRRPNKIRNANYTLDCEYTHQSKKKWYYKERKWK